MGKPSFRGVCAIPQLMAADPPPPSIIRGAQLDRVD